MDQIRGEALEVFKKLPDSVRWTIEDALEDQSRKIITTPGELFDLWLMYQGIVGYGEDILEFFKAMR